MRKEPILVYYVYRQGKDDADLIDEIKDRLTPLKRKGIMTTWERKEIKAGGNVQKAIAGYVNTANIFLILVSARLLSSDSHELEMVPAMERYNNNECIVVPIILRACDWTDAPFASLQVLPRDEKALASENSINLHTSLTEVMKEVKKIKIRRASC